MRINKKFVLKNTGHSKMFSRRYEDDSLYVNVSGVFSGVLFTLAATAIVAGLSVLVIWGFVQWTQVPSNDNARWNHQCDMIAGNKPHFVRIRDSSAGHECVIGPKWNAIRL